MAVPIKCEICGKVLGSTTSTHPRAPHGYLCTDPCSRKPGAVEKAQEATRKAEMAAKPVAKPIAKPVVKPAVKPIAKPIAKVAIPIKVAAKPGK